MLEDILLESDGSGGRNLRDDTLGYPLVGLPHQFPLVRVSSQGCVLERMFVFRFWEVVFL